MTFIFEYMKKVYDANPDIGRELFVLNQNLLPKVATPTMDVKHKSKKKKRRK